MFHWIMIRSVGEFLLAMWVQGVWMLLASALELLGEEVLARQIREQQPEEPQTVAPGSQ